MGDDELSIWGQILFTVKKLKNHLELENISPICKGQTRADFENQFSEHAKAEIASRCSLALSGEDSGDSFYTSLYGCPYIITLITQMEQSFLFLAAEEPAGKMDDIPENSAFYKLCSMTERGIFFWRVRNREFFLNYANASYLLQIGSPGKSLRKRPEDIYGPKKATLIRSQLEKCVNLLRPVSFNNKVNKKTFAVTLYPDVSNGQTVRVMGVSTDITEHVSKSDQLEQSRIQASQCETMLQEHIRFEEILSRSAREFLDSGLSGFNECLERTVQSLGPLFDTDWTFACKSNNVHCGISCQWLARPETGRDRLLGITQSNEFCTWVSQLRAGRIFVVNDIHKELPSLHAALKGAGSPEVRSFIAVPVLRSDEVWGVLCVSSFCEKRIWTTREISILKTAADIIMSAYLRTKLEKQLNESNRVLVEYDECLQDMLSVEESLHTVTRQFLSTETKGFGNCVGDMLSTLTELTDADQACITVLNGASPKCYSWHKKGLSFPPCDHDRMNTIFCGWSDFLRNTEQIAIEDVSQEINTLPASVQDYILSMGIKSLLIISIRSGDTPVAILFLAKVLGGCRWDNPTIYTSKRFADVFRDAYIKFCRQQQLLLEVNSDSHAAKEALAQAQLIKTTAECAQQLIDATTESLSSIYGMFCKSIAQHLPIDSINLTQYSEDYTKTFIVFNWRATGPLPKNTSSQAIGHDNVVLSIPVFYREIVWGCLLVNFTSQSPADGFMQVLEMVAECFVRAYMRIHGNNKDCIEAKKHPAIALSPRPFAI